MSKASDEVLAERQRQISEEGYNDAHDDMHTALELARAGIAYALLAQAHPDRNGDVSIGLNGAHVQFDWERHAKLIWPWAFGLKPKSIRRDLTRAAALLIAALDRLED